MTTAVAPFRSCSHDQTIYGRDDWPSFANAEIDRFLEGSGAAMR